MIQLANEKTSPSVRRMWERCFNDSAEFVDLYFKWKYEAGNTLIYFEGGEAVASLQLLPYRFTFFGTEIDTAYVSGACTLPEHRNRGYMDKLLREAVRLMHERGAALSILIPAEEWLYGYYAKYGYVQVFQKGKTIIPLESIYATYLEDMQKAYADFDAMYRNRDFCVQKTLDDFQAIIESALLEGFPPKTNLSGMARIIDAGKLLQGFAAAHPHTQLSLTIEDKLLDTNSAAYAIAGGHCQTISAGSPTQHHLNEIELCQFLFGSHLELLPKELARHTQTQQPIMNLMME